VLNGLTYEHLNDFIVENNEIGVMADNQLHCQGLLNLVDNKEDDGGFHLVPGFKHHYVDWVQANRKRLLSSYGKFQAFVILPESEPFQQHALRITCRAGSMVCLC